MSAYVVPNTSTVSAWPEWACDEGVERVWVRHDLVTHAEDVAADALGDPTLRLERHLAVVCVLDLLDTDWSDWLLRPVDETPDDGLAYVEFNVVEAWDLHPEEADRV